MNMMKRMNATTEPVELPNLDRLWDEARRIGLVHIHSFDGGGHCCTIKFPTISGTSLEAKSDFDHPSPHAALILAIDRANKIRESFK